MRLISGAKYRYKKQPVTGIYTIKREELHVCVVWGRIEGIHTEQSKAKTGSKVDVNCITYNYSKHMSKLHLYRRNWNCTLEMAGQNIALQRATMTPGISTKSCLYTSQLYSSQWHFQWQLCISSTLTHVYVAVQRVNWSLELWLLNSVVVVLPVWSPEQLELYKGFSRPLLDSLCLICGLWGGIASERERWTVGSGRWYPVVTEYDIPA